MTNNLVTIRVWGDFACFTRPEMKVERVSYPVMTPSAGRGILEAIFWEPQIYYLIDSIHVIQRGRWFSLRRNEVISVISLDSTKTWMKSPENVSPIQAGGGAPDGTQRNMLGLQGVEYLVTAEVRLTEIGRQSGETIQKYRAEIERRAKSGKCYHRPALGMREFAADFEFEEDAQAALERRGREVCTDWRGYNEDLRWVIPLDTDSNLIGAGPVETTGQKNRGKEYLAPQTRRPKNAGGIAEFLADNITGIFGLDTDPEKDTANKKKRMERDANNASKCEDFWRQIRRACDETQSSALEALVQFHEQTKDTPSFLRWGVSNHPKHDDKPHWWLTTAGGDEVKLGLDNFTFRVDGELLLGDEMTLRPFWRKVYQKEIDDEDASVQRGICLITGAADVPVAPTHLPKVKGVPHTQSFGAAIVSFDKPAFASYGFDQSHNAPSSTAAVSAYCNALNFLLKDPDHNLRIGQTSVCFWARETKEASSFFARMLNRPDPASVTAFLKTPWAGIDRELARHDQFYSVTLSGNAGRIVVRHWIQTTLEAARENLRQWFADLNVADYGDPAIQAPNQPPGFPRTFSLQEQGRFALGFYQQKAADDAARRANTSNDDHPLSNS